MLQRILFVFLASIFAISSAMAEVQINGFASVVTGIDFEEDEQSGYNDRTVDNLQDSKVALQWSADLGDGMRFVGQTMARGDSAEGFQLNYDWAYFDFNIGSSSKLKFGRLRIPFYKYSDYLDVGYAYHWITPPESMYSLTFSNMDGIGYQQNFEGMGMEHSLNLAVGTYQGILVLGQEDVQSSLENLIAINWTTIIGNHEFTAAYAQADVYVPATAAAGLAAAADASGGDGDKVLINGDYGFFLGVGYKGTFGDFGIYSEYSIVEIKDSVFADTAGGYLGVSYLMGDYTYHLTYGMRKAEEKSYAASTDALDLGVAGGGAANGTTVNSTARFLGNGESSTITLGVRKDIGVSTALKIDLDLYTEDRVQDALVASTSEEKKATVLKFAVETMF
ncbi:MAG: hypothetical protein HWE18_12985 [Gammaproteobacteria bacterium]|nr:hypothetical protein [Gammaproteobacteria bacterium]